MPKPPKKKGIFFQSLHWKQWGLFFYLIFTRFPVGFGVVLKKGECWLLKGGLTQWNSEGGVGVSYEIRMR